MKIEPKLNFKIYLERERGIEKKAGKKREKELRTALENEKEEKEILLIKEKRNELKESVLKKYPNEVKLQRYIDFLKKEAKSMGCKVKKLKIVDERGVESNGHKAERDFLNDVYVSLNERVLTLAKKDFDSKEKVFDSFIEFYSDELFQKDEVCELGEFTKNFLKEQIENFGVKIKNIEFLTGVGTPLDFNFGVDGWIKIIDNDDNEVEIYYDMKTGNIGNKSPFADLLLEVDEKDGKVKPDSEINIKKLKDFLIRAKNIYFAKRNQMLKDKEKIIVPNPKN